MFDDHELSLGPALAWVNLVVNRAWLRSNDCVRIAGEDTYRWTAPEKAWKDNPHKLALLQIENELVEVGIIRGRYDGWLFHGLDENDQLVIKGLHAYMRRLLDAVAWLLPVPVDDGELAYDVGTRVLAIPFSLSGENPLALGERVLKVLVEALDADENTRHTHHRDIVEWMRVNDRPTERAALSELYRYFEGLPAAKPEEKYWKTSLASELQLKVLATLAVQWGLHVALVSKADLGQLEQDLTRGVDVAVRIGGSVTSTPQTRLQYELLRNAVSAIGAEVALRAGEERAEVYVKLSERLAPYARVPGN